MKDKELRKLIGSRIKQRRLELNLTQPYVAEKMGVTASTILRYENGSIDNTKKMVLEGLSEALHVSVEWLKGETDEYETDITDKRELQIRDAMGDILEQLPLALTKEEDAFSKDLLLLMLKQYGLFLDSFQFACKNFKGNAGQTDIAKTIGELVCSIGFSALCCLKIRFPSSSRSLWARHVSGILIRFISL